MSRQHAPENQGRSRILWFILLSGILVTFAAAAYFLTNRGMQLGRFEKQFHQIQTGMSESEAVRLMGSPPGTYQRPHTVRKYDRYLNFSTEARLLEWHDDHHSYYLMIDREKKVEKRQMHRNTFESPSFWN